MITPWPKGMEDDAAAQELWLCDVCKCGDYRGAHRGRRHLGSCTMADGIDHGFQPCRKFHLEHRATIVPPWPSAWIRDTVFARFKRIAARG